MSGASCDVVCMSQACFCVRLGFLLVVFSIECCVFLSSFCVVSGVCDM